jgi:hypothetical protein
MATSVSTGDAWTALGIYVFYFQEQCVQLATLFAEQLEFIRALKGCHEICRSQSRLHSRMMTEA